MINQFGVKGFNLINGSFEFYEITVNGEYKGTVSRAFGGACWKWVSLSNGDIGFDCEHSAIVALKKHLSEGGK